MTVKSRIYLTGVGGQGTLTTTTLLARIALEQGIHAVAGEIHGMAQRGGVVESTVLLGGWMSPAIQYGEADILLGFEPLESLRGSPYLKKKGVVISSTDFIAPPSLGKGQQAPPLEEVLATLSLLSSTVYTLPIRKIGLEAGALQSGNMALLAVLCSSEQAPFSLETLKRGIKQFLPPKIIDVNLRAVDLGLKYLEKNT